MAVCYDQNVFCVCVELLSYTIFHTSYSHQESITTGSDRTSFRQASSQLKTLHMYVLFIYLIFLFISILWAKFCTGNQSRKLSPVITKPREKSHINSLYLSQHLSLFLSHFIHLYAFCSDRVLKAYRKITQKSYLLKYDKDSRREYNKNMT